ncbi:MAG: hypothetical protein Q8O42_11650 [Acidobacteriota bacterium]|nr:hypothetical protein [Acidobacteriota bacterium]
MTPMPNGSPRAHCAREAMTGESGSQAAGSFAGAACNPDSPVIAGGFAAGLPLVRRI